MRIPVFQSGICAALFFLAVSTARAGPVAPEVVDLHLKAEQLQLAQHPVWASLLHLHQGEPQIQAPGFLLTWQRFSPEAELNATLKLLMSQGQMAVCRFPARALWLYSRLGLPTENIAQCPEIAEFILKAPFEKLELVFADESVTQPASILGHSFLRVAGQPEGQPSEHAISFYTHAETLNLPKLLWESLITGKDGLFSLVPYEEEGAKYLEGEQRNLWRYEIRTTAFERELIRNHLFELKNSQLTYFFHRYNCATLLRNLLGLGGDLPPAVRWWSTPKDVVKDLHEANRIQNTQVQLADAWLVTHLTQGLPDAADIRQEFLRSRPPSDQTQRSYTADQIAGLLAYNRWLLQKGKVNPEAYARNLSTVSAQSTLGTSYMGFQVDPELNPRLSEGESYWRTEWRKNGSTQKLLMQWTPASHTLMQSRPSASAETELLLLSPTLSIDQHQRIRLEDLQVFSMSSWVPWDPLLRPWSTQTRIGYGSVTGHPLDRRGMHASLQLGFTTRQRAVDLFAVTGPGLRTSPDDELPFYIRTDLGGLWRHSGIFKSRLAWTSWSGPAKSARRLELEQSWSVATNWLAGWRWSETQQFSTRALGFGVYLMHSF